MSPVTLTLTGTDFDATAVVLLDGFGALSTSFLNSQTLTAVVPAGIPAGDYTVRVDYFRAGFADLVRDSSCAGAHAHGRTDPASIRPPADRH